MCQNNCCRVTQTCNLHRVTHRYSQTSFPVAVASPGQHPCPSRFPPGAAAEQQLRASWSSALWHFKWMWSAMLEQRVTAESPKGPDCQRMKMDWLIYGFTNFSSESSAATRNSGLTLQICNCHLDASDISPFLTWSFLCDCVPLVSQWEPQTGAETLLESEEIKCWM